jgi:hypothetical protein
VISRPSGHNNKSSGGVVFSSEDSRSSTNQSVPLLVAEEARLVQTLYVQWAMEVTGIRTEPVLNFEAAIRGGSLEGTERDAKMQYVCTMAACRYQLIPRGLLDQTYNANRCSPSAVKRSYFNEQGSWSGDGDPPGCVHPHLWLCGNYFTRAESNFGCKYVDPGVALGSLQSIYHDV